MDKAKSQIVTLKCMSRTFVWERWRWEVEKRKEEFISCRKFGSRPLSDKLSHDIHEIDPLLLTNPSGRQENHYLGRGSFGIVTLKIYRGIYAAVKQMHVKTAVQDIINEAKMLACLCHPFLPFLLGVCTSTEPFKIVMQFHGLFGSELPYSTTLRRELDQRHLGLSDADWISACAQILEAFDYLHNTVEIIHNDATGTNVLLGSPTTLPLESSSPVCQAGTGRYQILVIDFGKATKAKLGNFLYLSAREQVEYQRKFPQIAPEVVEGGKRQSTFSDMYSVGGILYQIAESDCISCSSSKKALLTIAEKCRNVQYLKRLTAKQAMQQLQDSVVDSAE